MGVDIDILKGSSSFFNVLFDNITSAIFLVDMNFRVRNFNNSFQTLFYKPEDLALGKLCGNAIGCSFAEDAGADCGTTPNCEFCELRKALVKSVTKNVPTDREILIREFIIQEKRILKYFQFSTRYIHFEGQEMVLVIMDDITEHELQKAALVESNAKLKELSQQKNELLGIAAHDLRNPLGVIKSFSEIMVEAVHDLDRESMKNMLEIIFQTSGFTLSLLDDILDFSKIESGFLEVNLAETDYKCFLKANIAINEILSLQKEIPIRLEMPDKEVKLWVDSKKIDQVLNNLISNAIKFSHSGSPITVTLSENENYVITSVTDKGLGIPEEELPGLFEPFRKSSVTPTNDEKSSGLGLAIVKKIIDGHGGKIEIKSKVGEGSTFMFYLPKMPKPLK